MLNKFLTTFIIAAVFVLAASSIGLACTAAGPNKHVGVVLAVSSGDNSFTIRDAETNSPMTFEATGSILKELKVQDQVVVTYKEEGGNLVAMEIRS